MLAGIFPHHAFKAVFWESYLSKPSPINLTLFPNSEVVGVCLGKPGIKNETKQNPASQGKKQQKIPTYCLWVFTAVTSMANLKQLESLEQSPQEGLSALG